MTCRTCGPEGCSDRVACPREADELLLLACKKIGAVWTALGVDPMDSAERACAAIAQLRAERDAAREVLRHVRFHANRHDLDRTWLTVADDVLGTFRPARHDAVVVSETHQQVVSQRDAAKAELARWRDSTQHWIVRDGDLVNFVLGNAFTTDEPYPGTQSEPLLEHIQNLHRHAEALEGDLAAAIAERDRLQQQLAENNAALARRMGI